MKVTGVEWRQLFSLLDRALELTPAERAAWLADPLGPPPALKTTLERLLAQHADLETGDFLAAPLSLNMASEGALRAALEPPDLPDVGSQIGPYRLIREIGVGGMGRVWLAHRVDGQLDRQVALKLPFAGPFQRELMAQFARERDILAALEHPHIARLYDAGVSANGQPFLALQYIDGTPINDYCDGRHLSVEERLQLFRQVLGAVQYAHSHLVVHRDLKPSNMLVTAAGEVQLLDFGIAKLLSPDRSGAPALTELGSRALTLDYAAPEQLAGAPITTATDVYSLGVVLFELLAGRRPYDLSQATRGALENAILNAEPRRPSLIAAETAEAKDAQTARQLRRSLRADLDTIVLKALKKSPGDRYATVDAFAADIENYIAGRPVLARPDTVRYRARRFLARNRLAVGAAAAVTISLIAGLGVAVWQAGSAQRHARIAQNEARTAKAVQGFIEDILATNTADQPNPQLARQTTARELLDRGRRKIATSLNDAPVAKLRVLKTLWRMYHGLDLDNEAADLARERILLARSVYGPADVRVVDALIDLGASAVADFQLEEARNALHEAEQILDHEGDNLSPLRARADVHLASYHSAKGDNDQRLLYADQAIALLRPLGPSKDLALALWARANATVTAGRPEEALGPAKEALALANSLNGQINSLRPGLYVNLGYAQTEIADFAGAESSLRSGVADSQLINGANDTNTLEAMRMLADLLLMTSRLRDSLDVLRPARSLAIALGAAGDSDTIPELTLLKEARGLTQYGRLEDARADVHAAEEIRAKLAPVSWLTARMLEADGESLIEMGDYAIARERLSRAADIETAIGWDKSSQYNTNVVLRTRLLMAEGRGADAAKVFESFRTADDPSRPNFLAGLERHVTEAEIALIQGDTQAAAGEAARLRTHELPDDKRMYLESYELRSLLVEGQALVLHGEAHDALPLLQRAVLLAARVYDPGTSPRLADADIALAHCYVILGDLPAARKLLAQATAIHATHPRLGEHYRKRLRQLAALLDRARERLH
jgi:serine/threonine-protein kinase